MTRWLPFVGGFLAMAAHIYLAYGLGDWLAPQRLRDAIGVGLIFAHLIALMLWCIRELPRHLMWPAWMRYAFALALSSLVGTLAWWAHSAFFLLNITPDWRVLAAGGSALSAGFWLTRQLRHPVSALSAVSITTLAIFVPIYATFQAYLATHTLAQPTAALLYFPPDHPERVWMIGLPFALCIACFGHLPVLFAARRA